MTKHSYMFSYSARDKDGNSAVGRYMLTGEETLHLLADVSDDDAVDTVENKIEEKLSLVNVVVMGITELPIKVKR